MKIPDSEFLSNRDKECLAALKSLVEHGTTDRYLPSLGHNSVKKSVVRRGWMVKSDDTYSVTENGYKIYESYHLSRFPQSEFGRYYFWDWTII